MSKQFSKENERYELVIEEELELSSNQKAKEILLSSLIYVLNSSPCINCNCHFLKEQQGNILTFSLKFIFIIDLDDQHPDLNPEYLENLKKKFQKEALSLLTLIKKMLNHGTINMNKPKIQEKLLTLVSQAQFV